MSRGRSQRRHEGRNRCQSEDYIIYHLERKRDELEDILDKMEEEIRARDVKIQRLMKNLEKKQEESIEIGEQLCKG